MAEQNLLSVEIQNEHSITTGQRETRIFVKMYVDAVHSGLIADMGADNWQTLCVIAAFMNEEGECYPTQDLIAQRLNVSRETANKRIRRLCDYRWNGQCIVKKKLDRNDDGTWDNARYTILPVSRLSIF
jgi:hypothetical protein